MINIKNRLLLNAILCWLLSLLAQGCIEDICPNNTTKALEITLNIQNDLEVITRATPDLELRIERGFVLVYNNNRTKFKSIYPINEGNIADNGTVNPKITLEGIILNKNVVVLILNPKIDVFNKIIENLPVSVDYSVIDTRFELGATGFEVTTDGLPMSGECVYGGGENLIEITRAVAKIKVIINLDTDAPGDNSADFTPANVKYEVFQQVTKGHITKPRTGLNYISTNNGSPTSEIGTDYLFNKTLDLNGVSYIYEYPYSNKAVGGGSLTDTYYDKNRLAIILKVTRGYADEYYRLDLYDQAKGKFLDVERNTHYEIFIKSVNSPGHTTALEALNSQSSNTIINYVVMIGDENKLTNGKMTIMANPDFDALILRCPSYTEIQAVQVKYVLTPGVEPPSQTTVGSISYGTLPPGISANMNPSTLTADFQSISFTIDSDAPDSFEYQIAYAIKLADLVYKDTLHISRKPELDSHQTIINIGDSAMVFSNTAAMGWRRMLNPGNEAGGYVSCDKTHINAIPVIEDKIINEYHATTSGKNIKYVIEVKAPRYIGRYSQNLENAQKHLIMEAIEETEGLNWEEAIAYCENKGVSDGKPWRLPKRNEFEGVYDSSNPFPGLLGGTFWLDGFFSTTNFGDLSYVAICDQDGGWNLDWFGQSLDKIYRVRCIRDL